MDDLEDWFDDHTPDQAACIALRAILRGLKPLIGEPVTSETSPKIFMQLNAALVHAVLPELRAQTTELLRSSINSDSIMAANLAITQVNRYEGAAARRLSRASSEREFAAGILRKAATETTRKLKRSKSRAEVAVSKSLGHMAAGILLDKQRPSELIGLLNRAQATHERIEFWRSIEADCARVEAGTVAIELFAKPLWDLDENSRRKGDIAGPAFKGFWGYWYHGFEYGNPLNWELLAGVALLPTQQSFESELALSEAIAKIEFQHLRALAYQPERIKIDSKNGLFTVEPENYPKEVNYENAIRKVNEGVLKIRSFENSNSYSAISDILDIIEYTIINHKNEPMFVHDDFLKALRMIIRRVEREELPAFDDYIENLVEDLNTGCIDIRGIDEAVANSVMTRTRAKVRKPNQYEEASLLKEISTRAAQSDRNLALQLEDDGNILANLEVDGSHPEHPLPEQVVQRVANRLPQMQREPSEEPRASNIDQVVNAADKANKLSKGVDAMGSAAEKSWGWLNYLISMF